IRQERREVTIGSSGIAVLRAGLEERLMRQHVKFIVRRRPVEATVAPIAKGRAWLEIAIEFDVGPISSQTLPFQCGLRAHRPLIPWSPRQSPARTFALNVVVDSELVHHGVLRREFTSRSQSFGTLHPGGKLRRETCRHLE